MSDSLSHAWMPDLCRVPVVFGVLAVVELVVLAAVLLRLPEGATVWSSLTTASLLAQWLALLCVTTLCKLRSPIERLPQALSMGVALMLPVVLVGSATRIVVLLDQRLAMDLTVAPELTNPFVLSCMGVTLLLTAAVLRYTYVSEQWRRQQAASAQAQVEALQARIRPHFLFNSMNTIASLIRHDPVAAERAVEDLSELFRAALGSGGGESTLADELHLTRRYLAIEALRLGERLQVDWQVEDGLPLSLPLPRLILQPLAENAILHGIARRPDGGVLGIQVCKDGAQLTIRVRNPLAEAAAPNHGNRHAHDNIAQRLAHRYGHRARMVATARDGYYEATLFVPIADP
ncbi:MAG TPA: histidine kinase [Chiayiivirga sp.]|nr:histidine kinase [Chiayiivirga sp.]